MQFGKIPLKKIQLQKLLAENKYSIMCCKISNPKIQDNGCWYTLINVENLAIKTKKQLSQILIAEALVLKTSAAEENIWIFY